MIHDFMINLTCWFLDWSWYGLFMVWPLGQLYWFLDDRDARKAK